MHIHIILILFVIPSLLLANKCQRQFNNPHTKRIEVRYWIAVIYKETEFAFLRQYGIAVQAIAQAQVETVIRFVSHLVRMECAICQINVSATQVIKIWTMILPKGVLLCVTAAKMDTAWRREYGISAVRAWQLGITRAILTKKNLKWQLTNWLMYG